MKTWTIVEFLQDASVEAVPSSWLKGDYCHWPILPPGQMMKAMKACVQVDTSWPRHAIKYFKDGTFDDYAKARAKAKVAEETSDLQSEVELSNLRKRKIVTTLTDSDEESESVLPSPPAFKRRNMLDTCSRRIGENETDLVLHTPPAINRRNELDTCSRRIDEIETDLVLHTSPAMNRRNELDQVSTNCSSIGDGQTNGLLKILIEQQHLLRTLMTDVLQRVTEIEKKLDSKKGLDEQTRKSIFEHISGPVNSQEEFGKLEEFLRDGENAKNVASELASIGGSNCASFVKRAMSTVMTDELAMEFSWLGKKGKKRFDTTKLATTIIDAAMTSKICATKNDMEVCMQKWLRRAAERKKVISRVFN